MNVSSAIQSEMDIFFIKHDDISHKSWVILQSIPTWTNLLLNFLLFLHIQGMFFKSVDLSACRQHKERKEYSIAKVWNDNHQCLTDDTLVWAL